MFFKTNIFDLKQRKIDFSDCNILLNGRKYSECISKTFYEIKEYCKNSELKCSSVEFILGFTPNLIKKIKKYCEYQKNKEAYAIRLGNPTTIWAESEEGFIFAVSTILALAQENDVKEGFIYDCPIGDVRGYRAFLPPRDGFEDFRKMVDFLAFYKYNSIILEVGGAMEYKRHPEINDTWVKMCKDVNAYSGRGNELQNSHTWIKNCFHCQNGGGDYLLQSEVKELVAYCRSRGLNVIPECPTLSHSDYIVAAHPEIAERNVDTYPDPYPDTYCPNHPDTYKYVFDILEEVIEVFEPTIINIGHDETYSVSLCPKCRNTPAPVIYSNDVWKIHNFLKERNIHVYMWGEKLLKAYHFNGVGIGGTGRKGLIPRLYPCRDLLPRDITFLHWYYGFNPDHDKVYLERGMDVLYGNMSAVNVKFWNMRRKRGIHGGFVSNWGAFGEEYMQRNLQYFNLVSTAYAFWCDDFEALGKEKQIYITMKELYRLKCIEIRNPIKVTHTTPHKIEYKVFYDGDFVEDDVYMLGNYELTYVDGTVAYLPVKYGTNITADEFEDALTDSSLREVMYSAFAKMKNNRYVYEAVYENPHPESEIISFKYIPTEKMQDVKVEVLSIDLCEDIVDILGRQNGGKGISHLGFAID